MPRRLSDLQVPTHFVEFLTGPEELVALSQLADDLIRRMPPELVRCLSLPMLPCPNTGQQSRITTGPTCSILVGDQVCSHDSLGGGRSWLGLDLSPAG